MTPSGGSTSEALLTAIRDLQRRRGRERRGLALAEGVRLVEEAMAAGVNLRGAAISPALEATPRGRALKEALERTGVATAPVTDEELAKLSDTEHPQGVLAVFQPREWSLRDVAPGSRGAVLVLDGVQDPGNVGTMLRTALGLGAAGVIALPGTAELTNPKVVRGSMGALFRLPAVTVDEAGFLSWATDRGLDLWAADAGGADVRSIPRTGPVALLVGNEGAGVHPELAARATHTVAVPLAPGAESLNVGVAAGILLYEVLRER